MREVVNAGNRRSLPGGLEPDALSGDGGGGSGFAAALQAKAKERRQVWARRQSGAEGVGSEPAASPLGSSKLPTLGMPARAASSGRAGMARYAGTGNASAGLTEDDVRRVVREELAASEERTLLSIKQLLASQAR